IVRHRLPRIPISVAAVAGAALAADVAVSSISGGFVNQFGFPLAELSTAVLIAAALSGSPVTRPLCLRPLVGLGAISYGLYVWQGFVFALVGGVPGVVAAVVVALVSYRYVERPFRRLRAAQVATREPAAAGFVVPAVSVT